LRQLKKNKGEALSRKNGVHPGVEVVFWVFIIRFPFSIQKYALFGGDNQHVVKKNVSFNKKKTYFYV